MEPLWSSIESIWGFIDGSWGRLGKHQTPEPQIVESLQVGGVPIRNIYIVDTDNHRVAALHLFGAPGL